MSGRARLDLYLNIGHTLDHLVMLIFPTAVLAIGTAWQMPYGELLPLALGGFVAFGACSIPAGWLADHWSRTGMMRVFFFGIGAATILTGLARTPFELAAGLTAIGLFAAIYHPVGIAMLVAQRSTDLGRTLGVNGVYGNTGLAFAALLARSPISPARSGSKRGTSSKKLGLFSASAGSSVLTISTSISSSRATAAAARPDVAP